MDNHNIINNFIIKLKYEDPSKENFLGVTVILLMDKSVFVKNSYVSDFIKEIFGVDIPYYATKSRTLMVAKICRIIVGLDKKELIVSHRKTLLFLNNMLDFDGNNNINKNKKSNSALYNMNKWMGGILDKNK